MFRVAGQIPPTPLWWRGRGGSAAGAGPAVRGAGQAAGSARGRLPAPPRTEGRENGANPALRPGAQPGAGPPPTRPARPARESVPWPWPCREALPPPGAGRVPQPRAQLPPRSAVHGLGGEKRSAAACIGRPAGFNSSLAKRSRAALVSVAEGAMGSRGSQGGLGEVRRHFSGNIRKALEDPG